VFEFFKTCVLLQISDVMDTYQHAEIFIRTNNVSSNLGVLFELCASYERTVSGKNNKQAYKREKFEGNILKNKLEQ